MQTRLASTSSAVLEIGWLFALVLTPLFFNVFSARTFEPDKTALLRSIALVMCVAWLIKWIEEIPGNRSTKTNEDNTNIRGRSRFIRFIMDTPCALLVVLFFLSYAFSTVISIFPRISFFGSYSRLQGLYTIFAYVVVFFILLDALEKKEQIERFFKVIIFASFPVSLYGILQHFQLDAIPWSTTQGDRITGSNMGNPIFVAAYLIMVVPITISMLIKSFIEHYKGKGNNVELWITTVTYIIVIVFQVACILFTQSRGPWLGFFGAIFVFFLGILIFIAQKDGPIQTIHFSDALRSLLFAFGGIITGFIPAYIYFFIKKKGFRWLWLGFVFQTIIIAAFIVALNVPETPLKAVQKIPYLGRLTDLSYKAESGTAKVRVLIWDGTIELIRSNPLRMIVGYGPESMKHVWDPFSPAELAQHESKSAAPDRAHNEAFDRIVTTGFIGLLIYMSLFGGIFYFGFKWLGLITSRSQGILFFIFIVVGCILGALLPRVIQGTFSFAGVGLSFGFILAVSAFMIVTPFTSGSNKHEHKQTWKHFLILGLLSGITAHFIEIHFGIAIVSTRLYFFAFLAAIIILGTKEFDRLSIGEEKESYPARVPEGLQKKGKTHPSKKKQQGKLANTENNLKNAQRYLPLQSVMVYSLLTGLIISTTIFSFVIHQPSETETFGIILQSLMGQKHTYGALILLIATYLMGGLLVIDCARHLSRETGKKSDLMGSIGVYTITVLLIFFISSFIQATYLKPDMDFGGIIVYFFIFVFILGLVASYFLMPKRETPPTVMLKKKNVWIYGLLLVASLWIISASNITPVRADIYLKLGLAQERNYRWNEGVRLVTRAIEADPHEETFYLNLGRILFGKANSSNDLNEKNAIFEKIRETMERAHSLNPMNSDHIANLGLLYLRWAELDTAPDSRRKKLSMANSYFQKALEKSPRKTIILNNWARVFAAEGNFNESIKIINRSLILDKTFAGTYIALGDIYGMSGKQKESLEAYEKAVQLDQNNADAMSMLGLMYFKEGRLNEALQLSRKATELRPQLMKAQSLLGLIYFKLGRFQEAINANLKVLSMRPSDIGAHRNLVILYEKIGRRDKAINHLETAIQFSSPQERQQLDQILQYLKSGKSHVFQGS